MSVPIPPQPFGVSAPKDIDGESVMRRGRKSAFLGNSAHKYTPKRPKHGKIQPKRPALPQ